MIEKEPPMRALYPIVGTKFREGAEAFLKTLKAGEPLTLEREPANAFDPLAVQVHARGVFIGYLPKKDRAAVAMAMDENPQLVPKAVLRFSANSGYPHAEVEE